MKSYVNFCARVSWDPCILATCVCRSLRPGSKLHSGENIGESPFLAWGDFHARSRFAGSTIPEEKWGTTRSLSGQPLRSLRSPMFFFAHTNFFSFSQCGARSQACPRLCLSIYPHQSLLWQNGRRGGVGGQFLKFPRNVSVSYGGWGERKRKRAGVLRSSREPRGAPFPSSHRLPRACYYFYWDTQPAEASAEKRAVILSSARNFSRSVANKDV